MRYRFSPHDKTVTTALRRIALEQLDEAIARAARPPHPGQIHALRKAVKKTRGLLRLVRPRFADFTKENIALRDAARLISAARDAEVMHATRDRLRIDCPMPLPPPAPDPTTELADFARLLAHVRRRATRWTVKGDGFPALADGLADGWTTAHKRLRRWKRTSDDEDLHDWRTSVKHHWYHARLLEPIWPEMLAPHATAADTLGELLGDHHDLSVLRAYLAAQPDTARAVLDEIAQRQAGIGQQALVLGERLLAEPAEALIARWRVWWRLWRQA